MPFKRFLIFCILSHLHLPFQSKASEASLSLLTTLNELQCGYINLCHTNATSAPPQRQDGSSQNPCCFDCSCSDNCQRYGNCCPDKTNTIQPIKIYPTIPVEQETSQFSCLRPQLYDNHPISSAATMFMVDKCVKNAIGVRQVAKCEQDFDTDFPLGRTILTLTTPIYMPNKNIVYKNIKCLTCNFENKENAFSLDAVLKCENAAVSYITRFAEPTDIIEFLRQSKYQLCNVIFDFPRSLKKSSGRLRKNMCISPDVSTCNITGNWQTHDPILEEACSQYYLPVQFTILKSTSETIFPEETVFQNMACFRCNYDESDALYPLQCGSAESQGVVELRLNLDPNIYELPFRRNNDQRDVMDKKNSNGDCSSNEFFDKHGKECREAECPLHQYKISGTCEPMFSTMTHLRYEVAVKILLKQDTLRSLNMNSVKRSDLVIALTSLFAYEFKTCSLSVWAKQINDDDKSTGKYPMLVFQLILHTKNESVSFETILKTFYDLSSYNNREYAKWEWKFSFADHIYFDEYANKAIDLVDNTELIDQNKFYKYSTSGMSCKHPIQVTNMHYCDRVQLRNNEFVNYGNELYLKQAGLSVYAREFFIDSKNRTYICIDKYNSIMAVNKTDFFDIFDTRKDSQQKETKDTGITKDFAFFIGCLALVTLSVAVALAKKKYGTKSSPSPSVEEGTNEQSASVASWQSGIHVPK